MKSTNQTTIEFNGKTVKEVWSSDSFKVYALDVNRNEYPDLKVSKWGNVVINGDIPNLEIGVDYNIIGIEKETKNGFGYQVVNIKRKEPVNMNDMFVFLSEILTISQAETLWNVYPDIVQRVKENRLDDIDFDKLKGIKEKTFEKIKQKIIDNFCLSDLVISFQGYLSLPIIKRIYNKYTSIEVLKQKLKEDPYKCLCGLAQTGFKTADKILLEIEKVSKTNKEQGKSPIIDFEYDLKTSPQRCLSCIIYLLEENENNGHTKMNLAELRKECMKAVPACADKFTEVIKDKTIWYDKSTMDCALIKTYHTEEYIAKRIIDGLNDYCTFWTFDIDKYRTVNGCQLSDEQMNVLNTLCKNQICVLNGSAGCVDCDTEFFNGTEWKRIADYSEGDKVLQYNEDGTAELVYPLNYIKQPAEQLWHFQTKYGLDQCLSDNHTCYYITSKKNLYSKSFKEIRINQETNGFTGRFITTFNYSGQGINLSDEEIKLMVATFADGSFYYRDNCSDITYTQARFHLKKERKKERLIKIIESTGRKYRIVPSKEYGYTDIYVNVPFRCKHFPKEWYHCNKKQLQIIADEICYWDGDFKLHNRYSTTNKSDADFIQFVYTALGKRATIAINNRIGNQYITNNKLYLRKSIEYVVSYTNQVLVGMCNDYRKPYNKTQIVPYKTKDGFEYCFTVPSHILVLRRNNKIFITGNCGKSFSTQAIINMLEDNHKTYCLFSPTGKAAKVLKEYTHRPTATIHRGLCYNPNGFYYQDGKIVNPKDKNITYNYYTPFGMNKCHQFDCDIIIVDEFSMVDIYLFKALLEAIDFNTTKLLMIGDNAQLCSVGCGNLLHDFMQSKLIPTSTLTQVFRYGEGGLMKVATDVRQCKSYLDKSMKQKVTAFGNNKDYTFVDLQSDDIPKNAVALYKKLLEKGNSVEDVQVLTAKNVGDCGAVTLNNMIQMVANPNYGSDIHITCGDTTYYQDDFIMQKVNNYKAQLCEEYLTDAEREMMYQTGEIPTAFIANGETGKIVSVSESGVIINFDGVYIQYNKSELTMIGLAYCITTHKSQGSSINNVIICTPKSHIFMLNSNLLYVAMTRMKQKCYHLGSYNTVNQAIAKKANLERQTLMQQLLKQFNEINTVSQTENPLELDYEIFINQPLPF